MKARYALEADQRLGNLIGSVRAVTRGQASWAETTDLVAERLRMHLPTADLLTGEQRYGDPLGFQRHVLHAESNGSFSVVALVGRPGHATPIHDHVTWCVAGVIQGCEHEERYAMRDDGWLQLTAAVVSRAGDVTGLVPPGDIHQVRNEGPLTTISLHIYGTDLSRLGSAVRRTYNLPVVAGEPA
jgi:predicted metal-dependent enzyme (double-stranded beta helix superfamily)